MIDLDLVPTDEMVEELKSRFDHLIFAAMRITGTTVDEEHTSWHGHAVWCQGLAVGMIRVIQDWDRERDA